MTRKQKRLAVIGGGIGFLVAAVLLVMFAFSQSIAYFYVPGDLAKANVAPGTRIRLGGLVESGTVKRGEGSTISYALLKAAEKYTFGGGKEAAERAKKVDAGSQTTSDTTGSSKAVNITINGKVRSINAASAADANALVALLRELESASNTSTT